jgi:hypothetical protein
MKSPLRRSIRLWSALFVTAVSVSCCSSHRAPITLDNARIILRSKAGMMPVSKYDPTGTIIINGSGEASVDGFIRNDSLIDPNDSLEKSTRRFHISRRIPQEVVRELLERFQEIDFFYMQLSYSGWCMDGGSWTTSLSYNGAEKSVEWDGRPSDDELKRLKDQEEARQIRDLDDLKNRIIKAVGPSRFLKDF